MLLVDDEPEVLDVTSRFPSGAGCRVLTAASVDQALAVLRDSRVDLVLTDLRLPGRGGEDLLVALRRDPSLASVRSAVMTGDVANAATQRVAKEMGVGVLAKPFTSRELLEFVDRQLPLNERTARPAEITPSMHTQQP